MWKFAEPLKTMHEKLKRRLMKDRPMTTISIRLPEDLINSLKDMAPSLGYSGYQPLVRAYISQGLRKDEERLENSQLQAIADSLRKQGVTDQVISHAIAEASLKTA
jgi:metal-responsive CopG/Arc/MetJ family transcriptional regulator